MILQIWTHNLSLLLCPARDKPVICVKDEILHPTPLHRPVSVPQADHLHCLFCVSAGRYVYFRQPPISCF